MPNRRDVLRALGLGAVVVGGVGCSTQGTPGVPREGDVIRIGYVSAASGALSPFGAADKFVIDTMNQLFSKVSLMVNDRPYSVEILLRDSQSDAIRAAEAADTLVKTDGVHLMLVSATPDISIPVSTRCELLGMPCISSVTPWQPWFFNRGGHEGQLFDWTFNFFWGLEDIGTVYADMTDQVSTNRVAGALWPNDPVGLSWGDPTTGLPPAQAERGYQIVDPGNYPNGTQDFSAQIAQFQSAGAEILIGVPRSPDFIVFWQQAVQLGFRPRVATVGRALLFPSTVEALGALGTNLSTEVWWSPSHPFRSSLTGQSAAELTQLYTETTGKQWIQPLGFVHALFEVAAAAFSRVSRVDDRDGLAEAMRTMQLETVVGRLDWTDGPVPNVAKTPLVGGQWRPTGNADRPFDLVIVSNARCPQVPLGGEMQPIV